MFAPQIADLPGRWPACRASRCGSTVALARADAPLGPIVLTCENSHFRGFRARGDFRAGGRFAGCFDAGAVAPDPPPDAPERRIEPTVRRRTEVLEDADRCALCGTPPAEHPLHPDDAVRTDRDVWTWLQRWRPDVFGELAAALTVARVGASEGGSWRRAIPATVRERVVDALRDSALTSDQIVPPIRLAAIANALSKRELEFAVNGLLIAACVRCAAARWSEQHDARGYVRAYVDALYDGDEKRARAEASRWRTMEAIAAFAGVSSVVLRSA